MLAVIFEVTPSDAGKAAYLQLAAQLKAQLAEYQGCLSIERFQSLADERKLLSLSFWQDAGSVQAWRNDMAHRFAQSEGKNQLFESYRIRVAEVCRDYTHQQREQAPLDSRSMLD
ncbi:Antibiotic biosynthesis monooxygenase [Ferrimonas balearica DSM 9799]|uniref:Antibiotic biosynthesis monooxygenase n=1 Tax=Ferrimonas balearica (strain DSM 9799 / CCM 4581 / KCTC 23876 / PAT) TaxID=550540 RepID=E1SP79_FERBD|nr:antibiotic biosynthesis monooxygenase [Ferrimonas balearica]ADN75704.1 Antibiotic biosynthesis monooxygenase [Ferrimonas balearica DSM 9799]